MVITQAPLPGTKAALMLVFKAHKFVCSIPGRSAHLDPTKIPPQDRDIHLVEFEFCHDTNPFPTLEAATAQHVSTVARLKNRSSRNLNRTNRIKVALYIISVGVAN
eukprot:scaffold149335_cov16-Tisochrysis_lutea.AAC.2